MVMKDDNPPAPQHKEARQAGNLAPGDVVSGLTPSELVEIQRIAPFGSKILVEGVGVQSRRFIKRFFTAATNPFAVEEADWDKQGIVAGDTP